MRLSTNILLNTDHTAQQKITASTKFHVSESVFAADYKSEKRFAQCALVFEI